MELTSLESVSLINSRLERLYGRHTIVNKPIFRLAYSEELLERRSGEKAVFADCNGVEIFLRMETGIHEVRKYPWLDKQWVIENIVGNPHQDVFEGDYIYNIIYAFKPNMPCPPWKAIHFFLQHWILIMNTTRPKRTEKDDLSDDAAKKKLEVEKARNLLDVTLETPKHKFDTILDLGRK
jgi:hypothetical protein